MEKGSDGENETEVGKDVVDKNVFRILHLFLFELLITARHAHYYQQ